MNDPFLKAYLSIVSEQSNPKSYSIPMVALAVKNATDDFNAVWVKGSSRKRSNE